MSPDLNHPRHPWARLIAAARNVPTEGDASAPYGFATRVAALAFAQERRVSSLFERFALRAMGFASLLAVFSVVLNYEAISTPATPLTPVGAAASGTEELELVAADDAVAIVLDLALAD
jgi:hypothetical protein